MCFPMKCNKSIFYVLIKFNKKTMEKYYHRSPTTFLRNIVLQQALTP